MNYRRDNKTGGNSGKKYSGRRFGGRSFGGRNSGGDSGRPTMHQAICGKCGKDCEVPFKPSGSKPVFCRDCFKGREGGFGGRDLGERKVYKAAGGMTKEQFEILNSKLDRILDALDSAE